jgi:hypothetical protein
MAQIFLIIGGVLNALLAVFHLLFWKIFNWPGDLISLSPDNRAIIQTLNINCAYGLVLFAIVSIFYRHDLLESRLGRFVMGAIAGFYVLRAALQLVFFGHDTISIFMFVVLLVVALMYDIPLHLTKQATARQ